MWLVTQNGVPLTLSFGQYKNPSQEADENIRDYNSALSEAQEADPAFDATMTAWKRAPELAYPDMLQHDSSGAMLGGRTLTVAGVEFNMDDAGRAQGAGMENFPPDGVLSDMNVAVAFAEAAERDLEFVEKTTLKNVKIWATKDPADPYEGGYDSALYRQDSDETVVRVDA